jgi:hypothetical protein
VVVEQVVMEIADHMEKINDIHRSNEPWKTIYTIRKTQFVARSDHAGYNVSADSFRQAHGAICAFASLLYGCIFCFSQVI